MHHLDESLSRVVVDFSGRPGLFWDVEFKENSSMILICNCWKNFFMGLLTKP